MRGLDKFNQWADETFPAEKEHADLHYYLAGAMLVASGIGGQEALETVQNHAVGVNPVAFAGTVAVSAVTVGIGGYFWRRGWQARDES